MGAWGTGFLDDDTTCDFLDYVIQANVSPDSFGEYFEKAIDENYLDYEVCAEIIVCSALIDSLVNKTVLDCSADGINEWLEKNKEIPVIQLKPIAVNALQRVLAEASELNELWMENEEEYPIWKANIAGLIERLSG